MKRRLIYGLVMMVLALNLALGAKVYFATAEAAEKDSPYQNLELFSYVMEKVRKDYVDGTNLTYQDLVYGALKGMVGTLDPHSEFLDPEKFKELQSDTQGQFGGLGIVIAFFLHKAGRTTAATSKADALLPMLGSLPGWAQHKWYVDEFYDFLIVRPLLVLSHIFHLIDKLLVDGLVDLMGAIPRWVGKALRPSQSGELHGYAVGMAGGLAVLLVIVIVVTAM